MRTNIVIDDDMMQAAQEATGLPTKRAGVEAALKRIVRLSAQEHLRDLRGKVSWEGDLEASRLSPRSSSRSRVLEQIAVGARLLAHV